LGTINAI